MKTIISPLNGLQVQVRDDTVLCENMCRIQPEGPITFASLFQTENDLHYRFNDSETLFQLSDGTGAVVEDGDPIGYITDLSVNGNHATQIELTMRSLLGTRYDATILSPDWIDDNYQWDVGGVAGTFWFSSQFGAQVFLMYSLDNMPMGQYYECGFFGRELSLAEQAVLLAYAESTIPVAAIPVDGELLDINYAASDAGSGEPSLGFRFTSDNFFLSAEPPFNDTPFLNFNGTVRPLNDTYVMEHPSPGTVLYAYPDAALDIQYQSIAALPTNAFEEFTMLSSIASNTMYFGSAKWVRGAAMLNIEIYPPVSVAASHIGYGLSGYAPDLTLMPIIDAFVIDRQNLSGPLPVNAKPGVAPSLSEYTISDNNLIGDIPSLSNLPLLNYVGLLKNNFTGYEGGGINVAVVDFGTFTASDNSLTEPAIDLILSDFEATIGTIVSGDRSLSLEGGTNAPPSAAGVISKNNLIAAGWTVTTN